MKLTKSKQFLADAIHASGKGWLDGAIYATQDKVDQNIGFWSKRPTKQSCQWKGDGWMGTANSIPLDKLSPNWHQCVLSREEYFSAYRAEPVADADGWIEWDGGECPVNGGELVSIKVRGEQGSARGKAANWSWGHSHCGSDIITYRLHKPEVKSTAVGDDETNLADKEELLALERSESPERRAKLAYIYRPSIEQLMQTYADRAHGLKLANEHLELRTKQAGEAMNALSVACKAAGFDISPITAKQGPELVITDWMDLQVGDIIEYVDGDIKDKIGMTGPVIEFAPDANDGMYVRIKCDNGPRKGRLGWPRKWRFIRRP